MKEGKKKDQCEEEGDEGVDLYGSPVQKDSSHDECAVLRGFRIMGNGNGNHVQWRVKDTESD